MAEKRGKNIIQNPLTLSHIYQYYIKDIDKDSSQYVDYKIFRGICEEFNKTISNMIIEDGFYFKVPYRLGFIRIKKNKPKLTYTNLKPDFGLFNKSEGKYKNKHLNEHTGGYYVRFYWNKESALAINKSAYSFIPTRHNKRYLSSLLKKDGMHQVNKYFD